MNMKKTSYFLNLGLDKQLTWVYTGVSSTDLKYGGKKMPYNYAKLLGRIVEKVGTQSNFAAQIGLSERSVSLKLNGKVGWKQNEIAKICNLLDIDESEIPAYFFTLKVQGD